jgi:TIR domain/WD domain, G-beta repeat
MDQKYWAFISYTRTDLTSARWLHKRLETYPIPSSVRRNASGEGHVIPKRLTPVFRDQDELAGAADLSASLRDALRASRSLIVVCSRQTPESEWVAEEVRFYESLYGRSRIFCVLVDGPSAAPAAAARDITEYLPAPLRTAHQIPLAVDLRAGGDGRRRGFLKLLAGIIAVDLDGLVRRDRRRANVRRFLASAAIVAVATVGALALQRLQIARKAVDAAGLRVQIRDAVSAEKFHLASDRLAALIAAGDDSPANRLLLGWTLARAGRREFDVPMMHTGGVVDAAFTPDGQTVVVVDEGGVATLYNVGDGRPLLKLQFPFEGSGARGLISSAVFVPDGKSLLTGAAFAPARLWDRQTGRPLADFEPPDGTRIVIGESRAIAVSPVGDRIAVAKKGSGSVALWPLPSGPSVVIRPAGSAGVTRVRFAPDGRHLAVADVDGGMQVFDVLSGQPLGELRVAKRNVVDFQFVHGNHQLIVLWEDGLEEWDWTRGARPIPFLVTKEDGLRIQDIEMSPHDDLVAGAATDGSVRLWHLKDRGELPPLRMQLAPEDERAVDLGPQLPIDARNGEYISEGMAHLSFLANGFVLAAMHTRGKLCVWDTGSRVQLFCVDSPRGRRLGLLPSPRQNQLLVWGGDAVSLEETHLLAMPFEVRSPSEVRQALSALPPDSEGPR